MTLSDLSIRKPVFAWMLMIGLLSFGALCFSRMGISQLPDVDFPVVTVSITWTGAPPESIEYAITDVIEDSVMTVEGIRSVSSTCYEGISNTMVEFELGRNIDVALQEIQTKIAQAQKKLPLDADPAVVTKTNPEDNPILWAALSGPNSLRDKVVFARDHLKDSLTTVAGVGDVRFGGYVDPNMRIWLNSNKMVASQISVDDVIAGLNSGNTIVPTGYIDSGDKETNVRVMSETTTPDEFGSIMIPQRGYNPIWSSIRIRDVARVEEGLADVRRISRINGEPAIGMGVIKQRGSNAVSVGRMVKSRVRYLQSVLPQNMKLRLVVDNTQFIEESTRELLFTLGLSALLTSIVCWLFLGSLSSAFNVVLAIPVSLIGSFIFLYFCGFTINTFTLLALSLSIGIVVDDAIMVLENIVRYHEKGMGRVKAALVGAREISGAATAASIAILAIFLPVLFMKGIVGKFFFQFGVAMSVSVMLSLLEALTLAPMRCSQFLVHGQENPLIRGVNRLMAWSEVQYRHLLVKALNHRWKVMLVSLLAFSSSILLMKTLKQEFVPPQDQGMFLTAIQTPMGSSMEFTDSVFRKLEAELKQRPEVENYYSAVGGFQGGLTNQGNMFITLKKLEDRPITPPYTRRPTQGDVMAYVRKVFNAVPGVKRASIIDSSLSGFSSSNGYGIQFQIQGSEWSKLSELGLTFMEKLKQSGFVQDVDSNYQPGMPELRVVPDRYKASLHGVTTTNIANTISAAVGSLRVGKYTDASGHRNDVRIKLENVMNQSHQDIQKLSVRNNRGEMVSLSDVVAVANTSSLLTVNRYNRSRTFSIMGNLKPGKSQADAMDFIDKTAKEILPAEYSLVLSGNSQAAKESFDSLLLALALGILVAYMVLGAQFNSFIHPLTVLLALPFSVTGAFLALKLTDISLNIYSMIGILLLMGIVKKNSILLVDFTNLRRAEGLDVKNALLEACPLRLRPILMTSIATVAAAIPAALALGPGAETTRPMATVVIGGVSVSTLLTLIVVPCAYSLLSKLERPAHQKELKEALVELGESI